MYVDLGAERFLGAEKAGEYIAKDLARVIGFDQHTEVITQWIR
jgi:hypothetical protein